MSGVVEANVGRKRMVPRDAATLVLVERTGVQPRILMGRRRGDLAFLANKYVFPGGRVDPADKARPADSEPDRSTLDLLLRHMRGRPSARRARALAVAAARELFEETGYALGDAERANLACLTFFARAITPPGRPRRYDTRFFIADARHASRSTLGGDGELLDLDWLTVEEIRALDLPNITRLIVEDILLLLARTEHGRGGPIPFYYFRSGTFRRDLL